VTESEDKPLKYPHMFRASSIMIINKIDLLPHLDFDVRKAIKNALVVNPEHHHLSSLRAIGRGTCGLVQLIRRQATAAREHLV